MSGFVPGFQRQMPSALPTQRKPSELASIRHAPDAGKSFILSEAGQICLAHLTDRTRIAVEPTDTHPQAAVTVLNEWTRPARASGIGVNVAISDPRKTSICAHIQRSVTALRTGTTERRWEETLRLSGVHLVNRMPSKRYRPFSVLTQMYPSLV